MLTVLNVSLYYFAAVIWGDVFDKHLLDLFCIPAASTAIKLLAFKIVIAKNKTKKLLFVMLTQQEKSAFNSFHQSEIRIPMPDGKANYNFILCYKY